VHCAHGARREPLSTYAVGVDVGGVIIAAGSSSNSGDGSGVREDTMMFSSDFLNTSEVPGAIDGVRWLVHKLGASNVFIISKAGKAMQKRTLQWLDSKRFYERTGMLEDHVLFTASRREKGAVAQRCGIHMFIDDKLECLQAVSEVPWPTCGVLFGPQTHSTSENVFHSSAMTIATCMFWSDVMSLVTSTIKGR
jgi:hypothetical protein